MTTPDTPLDLDALTALERAATPGPWRLDREYAYDEYAVYSPNGAVGLAWSLDDAELIAAARNALPALLSALAAARAEAETYKREVGHADSEREEAERHRDAAREQAKQAQAELRDAKLTIAARDAALDASAETHRIAQQIVAATLGATPEVAS